MANTKGGDAMTIISDQTLTALKALGALQHAPMTTEREAKRGPIAARLLVNDVFALMKENDLSVDDLPPVFGRATVDLVTLAETGLASTKQIREIMQKCFVENLAVDEVLRRDDVLAEAAGDTLATAIDEVFAANEKVVAEVRGGKDKAMGFLVGQTMKRLHGKVNPSDVQTKIRERIGT
jgi:aspartyl-tRNA(Asn)/glutamyl-tRNA(Gln) amidotransferase subunit B